MSLTELFSTSFFISIAGIFLTVSLIMTYISYRMSEQDHKISSMLGLISTMAQELEFFRSKLANSNVINSGGNVPSNNIPFLNETQLIEVSDDDLEESDSETDSDDDSDCDDDSDEPVVNDIKILNIHLPNESNIIDISDELNELGEEEEEEGEEDDEFSESELEEEGELEEDNKEEKISADTKLLFKSIHIEEVDYKKLPIQKLRDLALQKGLTNDASKLKKNDIIKLFSS